MTTSLLLNWFGVAAVTFSLAILQADAVVERSVPDQVTQNIAGRKRTNDRSLRVDVDLALVNVTVTDVHNHAITGLTQENFRVFEDNVEQEILHFYSEDIPISIGLILDLSGSMTNKYTKMREAAAQFLMQANPQDEFFAVILADNAKLASAFTQNVEGLEARLTSHAPKGRTALLDAVYLALNEMRNAQHRSRALVIVSDGGDNHSRYSKHSLKPFLKECDCQLYAIGLFESIWKRNHTREELEGPSLLSELTEMTGGRVFKAKKINELPDVASMVGTLLRNQYVLSYRPSNRRHDSRWRRIKVKLRLPKGSPPFVVSARAGYYAPSL
jgi:Ca-activated chloride channel homolog